VAHPAEFLDGSRMLTKEEDVHHRHDLETAMNLPFECMFKKHTMWWFPLCERKVYSCPVVYPNFRLFTVRMDWVERVA
jgi:hypothetical protein